MNILTEDLERMIFIENMSYEAIGKEYGCTGANIKKIAKRRGLKLLQRRKINECETFNKHKVRECLNCGKDISHKFGSKYCDNKCQGEYQAKQKYNYFLTSPSEFQRANFNLHIVKRFILEEQSHTCAICGMEDNWNEKDLVFIIDHIDGNAANNTRENLRCVCPNCDSQLPTYKSKNKNGARYYYRYGK